VLARTTASVCPTPVFQLRWNTGVFFYPHPYQGDSLVRVWITNFILLTRLAELWRSGFLPIRLIPFILLIPFIPSSPPSTILLS